MLDQIICLFINNIYIYMYVSYTSYVYIQIDIKLIKIGEK